MPNINEPNHEHTSDELKFLFKHLLLFFVVTYVFKFWNYLIFPAFPLAQIIFVLWTIILGVHLLLFFLSTGIIGDDYENKPVKIIAKELLDQIKDRNHIFTRKLKKEPISTKNNPKS
jgi:hypothetical protein